MKKLLLWFAFIGLCHFAIAQNIEITQNSYQKVAISFETAGLDVQDLVVPEGHFVTVSMPGFGSTYDPGAPALPQLSKLLQVPVCDSVVVRVVNARYEDHSADELGVLYPVYPSQVSASKSGPKPSFSYNQGIYGSDAFYARPLVSVEKAGVKRSAALANVYFCPVQYNPVTQQFRVYTHVDVEFTFVNANMAKTAALQKYASPLFSFDKEMVINKMQEVRNEYSAAPIKYLIIGNGMFASNEDLAAFVAWKKRLGYLVEVAYTSDANVGTSTTSIKNFIQSKYDAATPSNPAPTFLLLLGDREQLPAFNNQTNEDHITDLYYATLTGNDYLPDLYYGRLSATNNTELSHQIEKILMYEQYTMPDPSYLGNAVLIAGTDNYWAETHANGQVNYITSNYINTGNPRYTNVMAHLYNCSSQAAQIRQEVSNGSGWTNYTAHGSETSWADPQFTVSQVASLQNTDKYGLMIGNCCQSGNYKTSVCFGEALLRAEKKGAMGYIGASNNSYWNEDYYWAVGVRSNVTANPTYMANALGMYDKLFHTHNEDYSNWVSTIGGIMAGGNMAVQSSSSDKKQYYWEIYHCFGDPSVQAYLGVPSEMEVTANEVLNTDATSYVAQVAPYAYVAMTQDGEFVAAAFADANGTVTLQLPSSLDPGDYELSAIAQNYIPYFQNVQIITPNGPYVVPTAVEVAEGATFFEGNSVFMNLTVANVGVDNATGVSARLVPQMNGVVMLQDSVYVGGIGVQQSESRANAFAFVMPAVEDYTDIPFVLSVRWNDTVITRSVNVRALLPKVELDSYNTLVNNVVVHKINAGDEVVLALTNQNKGHVAVNSGSIDVTCNYSGASVLTPLSSISGLDPNASVEKNFQVRFADTVPDESLVPFYVHIAYDNIIRVDTLYLLVGGNSEDFESGDFSQNNWSMNNYPWIITNTGAHSGTYCARSAQNLPGNSSSRMNVTISSDAPSTLSYYRKVSSEAGYDKFILYVDGNQKDEASGNTDWVFVSLDVAAGTHTFRFSYEKDYSQASGSDCTWIDDIIFPSVGILVVEDVTDSTDVSVADYEASRAKVYPNPTNEWVVVESAQPVGQVMLYDLNGRVVRALNSLAAEGNRLNVSDLPSGFYMLKVVFENGQTQTLKIIKQ